MNLKSPSTTKTKGEVLEQTYLSAYDLQILIPTISYRNALNYIKEMQEKMTKQKYRVPPGQTKVALTWMIKEDLGI